MTENYTNAKTAELTELSYETNKWKTFGELHKHFLLSMDSNKYCISIMWWYEGAILNARLKMQFIWIPNVKILCLNTFHSLS